MRWLQIIISESGTGHKVALLEGHESYVKGLAWDPVGALDSPNTLPHCPPGTPTTISR